MITEVEKKDKYIICPKCGQRLNSKCRFCTECGYTISDKRDRRIGMNEHASRAEVMAAAALTLVLSVTVAVTCSFKLDDYRKSDEMHTVVVGQQTVKASANPTNVSAEVQPTPQPTAEPTPGIMSIRGTKQPIPDEIKTLMYGKSMTDNDTIGFDDLSYLQIPYIDFNGNTQTGEMVVAADLADEVLDIFKELYEIEYPIERMELVDRFFDKQTEQLNTPDRASMGNNNTSAFYYRVVSGTNTLSKHALGRAIDINAKVNPFVDGDYVSPANAYKYADRSMSDWSDVERRAFIGSNTDIYRIFISHGWEWGGEIWSYQDYQHFQKP